MRLSIEIKAFSGLSTEELYDLLRLRAAVFVVEQNCVYQDIDGKDSKALHVLGKAEGKIVAYTRIFKPGDYFEAASIGRVVIAAGYRNRKWGHPLMQASIKAIEAQFGTSRITISAQQYLEKFYETNGFKAVGGVYDEDGIPHIRMERL
jgi:ElaA protein